MPMASVILRPGVDVQKTALLNEAGISESQLIRFKEKLTQTYGGWETYVPFAIPSTVKDMHPWMVQSGSEYLAVGATSNLQVITSGSATDITPQTNTSNNTPNISISSGSNVVTIVDANSSASIYDTIYFNTPIAIGGLLLNGAYKVQAALGSSIYTINSSVTSSATVTSSGILPIFSISSGSGVVTVTLPNNNFPATLGSFQQFIATTTVGNLTIQGPYEINSVIDSTDFTIVSPTQASTTTTATMNGGNAQIKYYIALGPQPAGSGFGAGGFGSGGFGTGVALTGGTGTPITATNWTLDNWGSVLLACPKDGPIYTWSPNSGLTNAQVITEAPFFNGGIFISTPQQILVAWKSVQTTGTQDHLTVRWCDAADYTNWTVSDQTTAGSFHVPTGSEIIGGIQGPIYAVISTDIDVWTMTYIGGDIIFNFTRVGNGCGWIGPHAAGILNGIVYWCGANAFYMLGPHGVDSLPCPVWDQIFQNINTSHKTKVFCSVNAAFDEIAWFYPSASATENDSYVKVHIGGPGEQMEWDYGSLGRTAWIDASILGGPIGSDTGGNLYQHDTGNVITGAGLPFFLTGWWSISEGNELAFIDFVMPDFIWGIKSGSQDAQVNITFYSVDYAGDTPRAYGPYTVTQATEYINTRIRGRMVSALVQSAAGNQFWRLGRIRYRWAPAGRR